MFMELKLKEATAKMNNVTFVSIEWLKEKYYSNEWGVVIELKISVKSPFSCGIYSLQSIFSFSFKLLLECIELPYNSTIYL